VEDRVHDQVALSQVLDRLPPKEASALLLWARGYTEREIGQMIGVGRGGAHYLREMALKRSRRVVSAVRQSSSRGGQVSVAAKKESASVLDVVEESEPTLPSPRWVVYYAEN
jgi:hypothetical protein